MIADPLLQGGVQQRKGGLIVARARRINKGGRRRQMPGWYFPA